MLKDARVPWERHAMTAGLAILGLIAFLLVYEVIDAHWDRHPGDPHAIRHR